MIQRVGGAHALGLSIGVIVGCVTILILIFSGRLIIGPAFAVGAIREARYDGPLCQDAAGEFTRGAAEARYLLHLRPMKGDMALGVMDPRNESARG